MSTLQDYARQFGSAEEGYPAFIEAVTNRYARETARPTGDYCRAKCCWVIEFKNRRDAASFGMNVARLAVGGAGALPRWEFATYHLLPTKEARRLRTANGLRRVLLPFVTIALLGIGFLYLCVTGVLLAMVAAKGLPHGGVRMLMLDLAVVIAGGVLLAGLRWAQVRLRRVGRPHHAEELDDQRIKLMRVEVES